MFRVVGEEIDDGRGVAAQIRSATSKAGCGFAAGQDAEELKQGREGNKQADATENGYQQNHDSEAPPRRPSQNMGCPVRFTHRLIQLRDSGMKLSRGNGGKVKWNS